MYLSGSEKAGRSSIFKSLQIQTLLQKICLRANSDSEFAKIDRLFSLVWAPRVGSCNRQEPAFTYSANLKLLGL